MKNLDNRALFTANPSTSKRSARSALVQRTNRVTGLSDVDAVEIVGAEGGVALRALPLARIVTRLHALEAEDVEALCQHGVLYARVAARTRQSGLREQETFVFSNRSRAEEDRLPFTKSCALNKTFPLGFLTLYSLISSLSISSPLRMLSAGFLAFSIFLRSLDMSS